MDTMRSYPNRVEAEEIVDKMLDDKGLYQCLIQFVQGDLNCNVEFVLEVIQSNVENRIKESIINV